MKIGSIKVDPIAYASQGSAILGIRDSGKTYTSTVIAEQLFESGIPFIAFDPIGVWRFLRVPGRGRGYPVVVAGGKEGDIPLTPTAAPRIVEAAMQNGVSLIVDLYDINLSKADWRKIVMESVRLLLHRNGVHGLRHVFIEEAAEFAPQRVSDGLVYAEVEKLARMGGNARLGYTLINQRAEEVNKALLELCDNLFLHRQKGKNSLNSLTKWMDLADVAEGREIVKSLPTLPQGECWAWLEGTAHPVLTKVQEKNSLHPDRRMMRGDVVEAQATAVDVDEFVASLRETLADVEEEAKKNDPKELKKQITALQAALRKAERDQPDPDPQAIEDAYQRGLAEGQQNLAAQVRITVSLIKTKIEDSAHELMGSLDEISEPAQIRIIERPVLPKPTHSSPPTPRKAPPVTDGVLPKGERDILIAAAQHTEGCTGPQLMTLVGCKRSTRDAYVQRLKAKGYVSKEDGRVYATPDGIAALGDDYEPLPKGEALLAYWYDRLPVGERKVLEVAVAEYPDTVGRQRIDDATNYARSSRDAYLQRLKARALVTFEGRGQVKASDNLFD